MSKKYYTLPTSPDQPTIDDDFDFEDGFCSRLNKIQAIADLFFCIGESKNQSISSTGFFGLHNVLADSAEELRAICYKMLEWEGGE